MQGKSLLERLRAMEKTPDWRGEPDPGEVMASVLKHLQRILNTRQGSVPIAPDYGMPDFTNIASTFGPSDVPIMERTLASVISKYEPRLTDVQVRFSPAPDRPLTAVFTLSARLLLQDAATPVLFETVLNPDGHIQVSE